jgi:hypothetical protein
MARKTKPEIDFSPECQAAMDRLVALAHQLAAMLTGDSLSETGLTDTPPSQALAMGMVCFLMRADPEDIRVALFAEKSLGERLFRPFPAGHTRQAPLAEIF